MAAYAPFRPARPGEPFLLASDIDGTLLGDELGVEWLFDFARRFRGDLRLAYISGRGRESILGLVESGQLPQPDFIAGRVGTEIDDLGDPGNAVGRAYAATAPACWDRAAVMRAGAGEGVTVQDNPELPVPPLQAGFLWDGREDSLAGLRRRLAGFRDIVVYPAYGEYIDVLPANIGKGHAARFLGRHLRLAPGRVMVAGDSGNDLSLFETEFPGVLPSNSLDELRCRATAARHHHSALPAARGVFDGLLRHGLVTEA